MSCIKHPIHMCVVGGFLLLLVSTLSAAQDVVSVEKSSVFQIAQARLQDAETLKALSDEGQLLYQRDRIKLDGYQYCGQAVALAERGEFRRSIQAASKALILGQQEENSNLVASAKRDLAIAYSYAGDLERAEQYAHEAIEGNAKDLPMIAGPAYKTIGDVYARKGKFADAISFYRQAQLVASDKFRPLVMISLANVYVLDNKLPQARALYEQLKPTENITLQYAFKRGLGNLSLAEGKPKEALQLFSEALKGASGSDAAYHRLWGQEGIARSLLLLNDKRGALNAYIEAARMSESIRARFRSEEFKSGLFGDVQQIFDHAIALSMEMGDVDVAWKLSEDSRSRALLDVVRDRVVLRRDAAALGTEALEASKVRAALRMGEAIVEFHTLEDQLLAWVVRPSGIKGYVIKQSRKDLTRQVEAFRQSVFLRKPAARELGERLHALLIEPLDLAPSEHLLIVPHDSLHYLPFQALRNADSYLIERHALAVAPSASVAIYLVERSSNEQGNLVAFGNPGTDAKFALPGSEREVKLIGTLFTDKKIYLQNDASKRQFRDSAVHAGILHVAAHAEVDIIDPLQSRILLAPEKNDAGFLEALEVYDLDLKKVSLVTLSACETGLGRIARGDEILGFTRSFLTAGASGLVVSLWPVADDSTELLMTTLYSELSKGKEALVAMQIAQITVLKQAKFSQPFFWAPFDLVGDWRVQIRG